MYVSYYYMCNIIWTSYFYIYAFDLRVDTIMENILLYLSYIYIWDNPSQLTNSMIFQRCSYTTKQCDWWFPPMIWTNENNALEILLYI